MTTPKPGDDGVDIDAIIPGAADAQWPRSGGASDTGANRAGDTM
jgi:hypothetical protein